MALAWSSLPFALSTPGTLAEAALVYAHAGMPIFPLRPGEKVPCLAGGFHAATTDPARLVRWWRRWPEANLGLPTGEASGLVVLDIDPRHNGLASLRHLQRVLDHSAADHGQAPLLLHHTCRARSGGGGLHLFFQWQPSPHLRSTTRLAGEDGVDLRGTGGYIVVPPSRLRNGGLYRWQRGGYAVQPFPLLDLLETRARAPAMLRLLPLPLHRDQQRRRDPAYWLEFVLARSVIGNRHHLALFLACRLLEETALSLAEAKGWMLTYASRVPQGPDPATRYSACDALACLAWASTHASQSGA